MRTQVYHGESHEGMVVANYFVEGSKVEEVLVDGDICRTIFYWNIEKRGKNYIVTRTEELDTPLDAEMGKNKNIVKAWAVKATTEKEALASMINSIVKPYLKKQEHMMPVDAKKLRQGLEKHLLN
jgi:hypothetical protein